MSRIVITTMGSLGDLHPKIAIALELRDRGHDVIFSTHQVYQPQIEALGIGFHRLRPDNPMLSDPVEAARMMDLRKGTGYIVNWVCARLRETYADLLEAAKEADFILAGELVYAARPVAEILDIPWALGILQPASFFSVYDPPVRAEYPALNALRGLGPGINQSLVNVAKRMSQPWAKPIHQLRAELGLAPLRGNPFIDDKFSPDLVLALFSPAVVQPQPDWPTNTLITGFMLYDDSQSMELSPDLRQFLAAGDPPIVFTLGSAAVLNPGRFYQASQAAAQQLNRRAVLLIGKNEAPAERSSDIIAVNYAPYSQVFAQTCAIVHQGGIGTTAQALRAGRPTVVVPYSHDQPDNAARVERLGTSRTIPRQEYSASRVVTELREILTNPNYAAKAAEMGDIIQSENGVRLACNAIEHQL
jgi:UDP:flavonoid glycosyltransferase YjiC (YdhE family)